MPSAPKLSDQLCFAAYSFTHALNRAYRPLLEPLGLTYPQYLVMLVLWEADGQTVKEIGERLKLDSGTLTPLLKRLETGGYLTRQRGRQDERQVIVNLTNEGKALSEKAAEIPTALGCAMGAEFAEISELREHLLTLRDRLVEAGCAVGEVEG
ncbi:MarR family transcriptional regulator [Pleomorphomonas diazotrophica]|uniref:MarR family transcriptional regulator n=1 Tax=Pleomorphomonas diazotrophica TaxID=1166257 RepID=A0A1I4UTQ4_9HYPH|nr:MarR family transcriptional regulator [Pleomorphomonas diazotrophica]PKR89851.1 MarR family transcriptional regulator [Pleomorphomonas diazotrophica]SFM92140.1 DNA-binding transcriptional regulator, MarR family [Pleomorphomonas diazotrophica]